MKIILATTNAGAGMVSFAVRAGQIQALFLHSHLDRSN